MKKIVLLLALCLLGAGVACADPRDIADYQLSLLGYSVGMSYAEAADVRPFHRVSQKIDAHQLAVTVGYLDGLFIDDYEFSVMVSFTDNMLDKVIGRFDPMSLQTVAELMRQAYGPAFNRTKTINRTDGSSWEQLVLRWEYPNAKMVITGDTGHKGFATISLLAHSLMQKRQPAVQK